MIKKLLTLLLTLLPLTAVSQQVVGSWMFYPLYNGVPTRVVDTSQHVYYVSMGRLYGYDKSNDETRDYVEQLNGNDISVIDYNPQGGYLFIGYTDGNIDLLFPDGEVKNLPDIREALISNDRRINEVDFNKSNIYVATNFGLVVFDADKGVVTKSGIYGKPVNSVAVHGDYVIINIEYRNLAIKADGLINRIENFIELDNSGTLLEMKGMGNSVIVRSSGDVRVAHYDFDNGGSLSTWGPITKGNATPFMRGADGKIRTVAGSRLYAYDDHGTRTEEAAIPSTLSGNAFGTWRGASSLWAGSAEGVGCYDITGTTPTVKNDRMTPADALSVQKVAFIRPSADDSKMYVGTAGTLTNSPAAGSSSIINYIEDGNIIDVTPSEDLTTAKGGKLSKLEQPSGMWVNPVDPDMLAVSSSTQGVYVVKDKKQLALFTDANSTMEQVQGAVRAHGAYFDKAGNLWTSALSQNSHSVNVLPATKLKGNLANVKKSDWVQLTIEGHTGQNDAEFREIPGTNIMFMTTGLWNAPLVVYDHNGTISNTADDKYRIYRALQDQDGKSFSPAYRLDMEVDRKGRVWILSESGPYYIANPADAINTQPTITRPKIARDDGSNFADYLLDAEFVCSMAVDGSDNKWFGTRGSGLYYVNSDGTEILGHYTTDNSPLPTNDISALYADPGSNFVYVGTPYGLLRFSGFHSPGAESYDEVYAYPNPVRPGYSGWITVKGLMDNSLVKIVDAAGSVICQGRSEGGMYVWDGCNSAGARVKSGVYYVYASTGGGNTSGSSGAVTKILIMN